MNAPPKGLSLARMRSLFILCMGGCLLLGCGQNGPIERPDNDLYGDLTSGAREIEVPAAPTAAPAGFDADYGGLNRTVWNKPERVISLFGDLTEKTVADIGAGTGFFSLRLAGKADKVIAIDIDPTFVTVLDSLKREKLPVSLHNRLETRLATSDDPLLAANEVDDIIMANVYMYMRQRVSYLRKLRAALRPGGQILIIDFKKQALPLGPPTDIKLSAETVVTELRRAGFRDISVDNELLDYQYVILVKL